MQRQDPNKTKRLGELLVDAGVISSDQLQIALAEQRRSGARLGDILVDLGIVSDEAISRSVASQTGVEHLDLDEIEIERDAVRCVPEEIARRHSLVPIRLEKDALIVAMVNPVDIMAIDDVERTSDLFVEAATASRGQILRALDRVYTSQARSESAFESVVQRALADLMDADGDSSTGDGIIALVEEILALGLRRDATDIHLEPDKHLLRVRLRIDGGLVQGPTLQMTLLAPLVARIKILAELDISQTRLPQDGKIRFEYQNRPIDLRVSTFPCINGESVVIRVLDQTRRNLTIETIGLEPRQREILARARERPNGLILTAGPTGSGKTSTLYALLAAMDTSSRKVITVEDPVEYELSLAAQCQVNEKAGLTFAAGLRSILRHDPDVILVGEMRDQETCQMAFRAALTGHLVLSTIHTNDSLRTVARLRDMDIETFMIASCLATVCAQRLARLICPACRVEYEPQPEQLVAVGLAENAEGSYARGEGCELCHQTGVRGREALFEVLDVTPRVSDAIAREAGLDELEQVAVAEGLVTFREQAQLRARQGRMTLDEVARVTTEH
jgi:type IV pilus assembly protein PilB